MHGLSCKGSFGPQGSYGVIWQESDAVSPFGWVSLGPGVLDAHTHSPVFKHLHVCNVFF